MRRAFPLDVDLYGPTSDRMSDARPAPSHELMKRIHEDAVGPGELFESRIVMA